MHPISLHLADIYIAFLPLSPCPGRRFRQFKEIETEGSVWNVLPASIQMKLNKKVKGEEFWPRLMKDKILEKNTVTIDWDR